jgi:hypothetical protein
MEVEMLLHLPIIMFTTLSPIGVSDTVPKFDISKECRFESESAEVFARCARDETDALQQIEKEWPQFAGADRNTCFTEATIGGFASYVELQICLEMSRDVRNEDGSTRGPVGAQSTPPASPEVTVLDKRE